MLKVTLTTLALVLGVSVAHHNLNTTALGFDINKCQGQFFETTGLLAMDCFDDNANIIERYQRLYTRQLTQECSSVDRSTLVLPSQGSGSTPQTPSTNETSTNQTATNETAPAQGSDIPVINTQEQVNATDDEEPVIAPGPSAGNMISCCDYFQNGTGYEFSICEGLGALIRPELTGGDRDNYYGNQTYTSPSANFVWTDFGYLIDNFCTARQQSIAAGNPTNFSIAAIWGEIRDQLEEQVGVPLDNIDDIRNWLFSYIKYLDVVKEKLADLPNTVVGEAIIKELNATQPEFLQNVTMAQLSTVYSTFYQNFIVWFNNIYGPSGFLSVTPVTITNGDENLTAIDIKVGPIDETFVADLSNDGINFALQQIADWIALRFGGIVLSGVPRIVTNTDLNTTTEVPPTSGSGQNETDDNSTIPQQIFVVNNYTTPEQCNRPSESSDLYCCDDGSSRGCYTLVRANNFWNNNLTAACPVIQQAYDQCQNNGEDLNTCLQTTVWPWFSSNSLEAIYAFMKFDDASANLVREQCGIVSENFNVPQEAFSGAFDTGFGDLGNQDSVLEGETGSSDNGGDSSEQPSQPEQPEQPEQPAEGENNGGNDQTDNTGGDTGPGTVTDGQVPGDGSDDTGDSSGTGDGTVSGA